jgi:hypothetical protein
MDNSFDKLNLFFDRIKSITFWQRIFGWAIVRSLSYEAYEEFKRLVNSLNGTVNDLETTKNSLNLLSNDNKHLQETHTNIESELQQLQGKYNLQTTETQSLKTEFAKQKQLLESSQASLNEQKESIATLTEKVKNLETDNHELRITNNRFQQTEEDRKSRYEEAVANINMVRQQIQDDRNAEIEHRQQDEIEKLTSMKDTWAKHQTSVKNVMKGICQKHTIEYVEKVPFKGSPDNTIKICDEFIVFDAKSPASEDLQNFPTYIKKQAETVAKYVKEENVKKDIFLVIPSNTVSVIDQFCYNMADYNVYVITLDSIEPIMLCLQRIEDYEFAEQLSPEERENICRIIGKFAHTTKRRIQIDQFFAREFFEILTKCEADIPRDILAKVVEFEKADKLNPSNEKRAKQIPMSELRADTDKVEREATAKGIVFPTIIQEEIKTLPLYNDGQG